MSVICDNALDDRRDVEEFVYRVRQQYMQDRVVFIHGLVMQRLVRHLGASASALKELEQLGDDLDADPTLPFRRSRNGRLISDDSTCRTYRGLHQPFVLTHSEDFIRHDSGCVREFSPHSEEFYRNTVVRALTAFKMSVISGIAVQPRPDQNYASAKSVSTVFHLRTITDEKIRGEPALEGVHTDGVDHTMVTFLGGRNMSSDSAITRIHERSVPSGLPWREVSTSDIKASFQHCVLLDTLILADHEFKHSVTAVEASHVGAPAVRDVLIYFTRKPKTPEHISSKYDSTSVALADETFCAWKEIHNAAKRVKS